MTIANMPQMTKKTSVRIVPLTMSGNLMTSVFQRAFMAIIPSELLRHDGDWRIVRLIGLIWLI